MTKEEILLKLNMVVQPEAETTAGSQNRGASSTWDNENLSHIARIAEDIEKDHSLAKELWETQWPAAQLLSFLTEQPGKVTELQLDHQIQQIATPQLIDVYCKSVVFESPYLNAKVEEWSQSETDLIRRGAYILLSLKAKKGKDFTDADFTLFLDRIEIEIENEVDMVKEAMYSALIAIGRRNRFLNQKALDVANNIGDLNFSKNSTQRIPDARCILQQDSSFTNLK